ncbi:MAG: UTP--glucose-1-phosphate uridylyltransferase [Planctomycetaceae bacterium]|nr:UTP--glucose-1-phosphate uridylyltransferase [Planctomycetaceae bacterium]
MNPLVATIVSDEEDVRHRSLDSLCHGASLEELQQHCAELDAFRRTSDNLYHRVRALFFLAAIHRYQIPAVLPERQQGLIPFDGYCQLLGRRFAEAADSFLAAATSQPPNDALASALAHAYHAMAFQTLADQVRRSVRTVPGNQWMFRMGHPDDHPLRLRRELLARDGGGAFPVLAEQTAVRMDFSHSAWSDIFFLGMDFPEGARVLNASINLGVHGRDAAPRPPIETYLRVIDEPVLRLVSVDLEAVSTICRVDEVFDFARDYNGLLKAAVIAAGIVPPGMEGSDHGIEELLARVVGPGLGVELVSKVNGIPKGSRLAVSTNLLGSLISICMRATGQVSTLVGALAEADRRIVAARAILGEWIGGSGGGWQDSGGVWPGIKLICGAAAQPGDPEHGVSRGRLLPTHDVFGDDRVTPETRQQLQDSLVLVHGGMAQNVGPILEMVTEKYLLRGEREWQARHDAMQVLDDVVAALEQGDIRAVGAATTRNFTGPLQQIIPWATNLYTDTLIDEVRAAFGKQFWGFWMLGGMSGGGMGFVFDPAARAAGQQWLAENMPAVKARLERALPFAMEPVVYDFTINDRGTWAELRTGRDAAMPESYYLLQAPAWIRSETRNLSPQLQGELQRLGQEVGDDGRLAARVLQRLLPHAHDGQSRDAELSDLLRRYGFDPEQHEQIRGDLRAGRIGLAQNRLPASAKIEDVHPGDVVEARGDAVDRFGELGAAAIRDGQVAVISLAAGAGSRWTGGAGTVKTLHPFAKLDGRHRNFLEVHLAKTRRVSRQFDAPISHVFTTGYMTDEPIRAHLADCDDYGLSGGVFVSPSRSVGLRMIPMVRDLRFAWEEMPQQVLDEQQEKVRASVRAALIDWAVAMGEGADYTDNQPRQCLHPVGHWYEAPNMLRNGVMRELLQRQPQLKYLMLHNIDTLGADVDPRMLGACIDRGWTLAFEVIGRRLDDRGGGLARVDGQVRLVEGLALPREEDEFALSYYNSQTTWIDLDRWLAVFGLTRNDLSDDRKVDAAVRRISRRMPTYITLKDVKKRWGHGQEDVYPVSQFEKLWSDMTALPEVECGFLVVPTQRGQQLKQPDQLDGWLRDGSAAHVAGLCEWDR